VQIAGQAVTTEVVGEGVSVQKENEGIKREICQRQC
jgi:hypothetical protein